MIDWRHWHNEPYLVGGLVLIGWLWAILAGPLRERLVRRVQASLDPTLTATAVPFPTAHAWRFYSAIFIFYLAVGSPLDQIGEGFLFSVHMLQHQLLIYPAAALFLLGVPSWMLDAVLLKTGVRARSTLPGKSIFESCLRFLIHPTICAIVYTLVVSVWHMPSLYDLALRNKVIHVLEHLMFFGAALFYWWPMLSPSKLLPPISYAAQMLFFLAVLIGMTPVFAYITFSDNVLYPTYEYAPRIIEGFTAASDQLLAGASMKIVGMFVALAAIGVSFYRWSQKSETPGPVGIPRRAR